MKILSSIFTKALIFLVSALLFSCTAFKDIQAVNRVTASKPLMERVKPSVDSLWPCKIDTLFNPGRIDSFPLLVYVPVFLLDTTHEKVIVDSLEKIYAADSGKYDCQQGLTETFTEGYNQAIKDVGKIKIPHQEPDTVKLRDTRGLDDCNIALKIANEEIASQKSAAAVYKMDRKQLLIGGILLLIILVGSNGAWVYSKFK